MDKKLLIDHIRAGDTKRVREAAKGGADVNAQDDATGDCALAIAARETGAAMVRLLIELGADANNSKTVTPPISAAAAKGDLESVRVLLEAGATVDVTDEDGATPLMDAAAAGHRHIVQELLAAGANVKAKDRYGKTALAYAAEKNHADICALLMPASSPKEREKAKITLEIHRNGGAGEDVSQLIMYATRGDFDGVVKLVEAGLSADAINAQGTSALMRAANKGHVKLLQWLLDKGADVNRKDVYGEWPLSYAAMGCRPSTYDFLYSLTDKKLRKRAEKIKQNQIDIGNWPSDNAEHRQIHPIHTRISKSL